MKVLAAIFTCLLLAQPSYACFNPSWLTYHDEAYADVIFEGEIRAVWPPRAPIPYKLEHFKTLMFDVKRVVRGELDEGQLVVGWQEATFKFPDTVDEFEKEYGSIVRVAITTPDQVKRFCEKDKREGKWCNAPLGSHMAERFDLPFVLTQGCSTPYIFLSQPGTSVKDFNAIKPPYGWNLKTVDSITYRVAQKNLDYFERPLSEDSEALAYLVDEARKLAIEEKHRLFGPKSNQNTQDEFAALAKQDFLQISDWFERVPEIKERYKNK